MTESGLLSSLTDLVASSEERALVFAADPHNDAVLKTAFRVRAVEFALLDLFGKGKLHGTIHTCVGQELTGAIIGSRLADFDFVTSNHRCHGHFIGATGNWRGLIDEIVGNADGVCAGIGSSQHLWAPNFISNGQQAGLLPVAAGLALDRKRRYEGSLVTSFIGEGTLGEGVLYETLNLSSLWELPHLIVCENNFYSQSTPQSLALAGEIGARAAAFNIDVHEASIWDPVHLTGVIDETLHHVRTSSRPAFLVVKAYRLQAHSKGDDQRPAAEIGWFNARDPLNAILRDNAEYRSFYEEATLETNAYAAEALKKPSLAPELYFVDQLLPNQSRALVPASPAEPLRIGQQLNRFYSAYLRSDENAFFIGEDLGHPYGGAFKIADGMQSEFPDRVLSTPISEAAIVGIGAGLAIAGNRPFVEIMFGDFMTLTVDQIVNNAAKFFHMYNRHLTCPLVVRTPMGGRRGYGPTHSQSLERMFVGMDNTVTLSTNSLIDVADQLAALRSLSCPAIVFENKVDYTLRPFEPPSTFTVHQSDAAFPTVVVRPVRSQPTLTIVSYGGIARLLADNLLVIFDEADVVPELVVPTCLHPLDMSAIHHSLDRTRRIAIVEEGSLYAAVGSEILARIAERSSGIAALRIGARPMPIPSTPALEELALPGISRICDELRAWRRT